MKKCAGEPMLRPSVNKFDRGGQSAHGQQLPSRNFSDIGTWREVQERQAQGTWMRTVERECGMMGFKSWEEAGLKAVDRVAWRSKIFGPILRFHQSSLIILSRKSSYIRDFSYDQFLW